MKNIILSILLFLGNSFPSSSQGLDSFQIQIDQIEKSLMYKTGVIDLESENAKLTVPNGFKFLDKEQSNYVLEDLWGNPKDSWILGLLVPKNHGVLGDKSWVFIISYDEMGFVKDDDAEDIDYDELRKEQQKEFIAENPERIKLGYQPV